MTVFVELMMYPRHLLNFLNYFRLLSLVTQASERDTPCTSKPDLIRL